MKKSLPLLVLLLTTCLSAFAAEPDVTGRWATAANARPQVKLSIARTDTGYSISHFWSGSSAGAMGTEEYPGPVQGASGMFALTDTSSSVPAKMSFTVKDDTLTLQVPAGDFAGKHILKRTPLTTQVAAKTWERSKDNRKLTVDLLVGRWQMPESAPLQAAVVIEKQPGGDLMVSAMWSDDLAQAMAMQPYKFTQAGGIFTLTAVKPNTTTPEFNRLEVSREGDFLVVVLASGHHAGTYLLPKAP